MAALASWFSTSGRIAPRPFALVVAGVYLGSFLSQVLLSPAVTMRLGVAPFAVLQALLIWTWLALHARRLRDAGRPSGPALAIALLYALAMVLLMLILDPIIGPDVSAVGTDVPRLTFADVWVFLLLFSAVASEGSFGFFDVLVLMGLLLILTPVVIALGFSVWAGTRPPQAQVSAAVL